jgi:hypothetical protein
VAHSGAGGGRKVGTVEVVCGPGRLASILGRSSLPTSFLPPILLVSKIYERRESKRSTLPAGIDLLPTSFGGPRKVCQKMGPCRKSTTLVPVIKFELLAMMGLDFLGPITLSCKRTGAKYMLIAMDYFTRYTWIRPYRAADGKAVISFFDNFIAPNFGFPYSLYTDNGTHFVGNPAAAYFASKGIQHYDAPVSHPSSVGLAETVCSASG